MLSTKGKIIKTNLNFTLLHPAVSAAGLLHVSPVDVGGHINGLVVLPRHQDLVSLVQDVSRSPRDSLLLQLLLSFDGHFVQLVLADCPHSSNPQLRQLFQQGKGGEEVVKIVTQLFVPITN